MKRDIKFRQPIFNKTGQFSQFHYWGFIDGRFHAPANILSGEQTAFMSEQFTGLKDQEGIEIYEGDIVEFPEYYETPEMTNTHFIYMPVVFLHGAFYIQGKEEITVDTYNLAHEMDCYDGRFTVIGNIHKNPELL